MTTESIAGQPHALQARLTARRVLMSGRKLGDAMMCRFSYPIRDKIRELARKEGNTDAAMVRQLVAQALIARGQLPDGEELPPMPIVIRQHA